MGKRRGIKRSHKPRGVGAPPTGRDVRAFDVDAQNIRAVLPVEDHVNGTVQNLGCVGDHGRQDMRGAKAPVRGGDFVQTCGRGIVG